MHIMCRDRRTAVAATVPLSPRSVCVFVYLCPKQKNLGRMDTPASDDVRAGHETYMHIVSARLVVLTSCRDQCLRPSLYPTDPHGTRCASVVYIIPSGLEPPPVREQANRASIQRSPLSPASPNHKSTRSGAPVRRVDAEMHHHTQLYLFPFSIRGQRVVSSLRQFHSVPLGNFQLMTMPSLACFIYALSSANKGCADAHCVPSQIRLPQWVAYGPDNVLSALLYRHARRENRNVLVQADIKWVELCV